MEQVTLLLNAQTGVKTSRGLHFQHLQTVVSPHGRLYWIVCLALLLAQPPAQSLLLAFNNMSGLLSTFFLSSYGFLFASSYLLTSVVRSLNISNSNLTTVTL